MKLGLTLLGLTAGHFISGFDHDHVGDDVVPAQPVIYNPPAPPMAPSLPGLIRKIYFSESLNFRDDNGNIL